MKAFASSLKVVACLFVLTVSAATSAHADQTFLSMFKKKLPTGDAKSLALKAEHGPWLILAATISGEDGQTKAVQLANEIRTTLKLPAFVLKKEFDSSGVLGATQATVAELDGTTTKYRAWTQYANPSQDVVYAVLVGEFPSTEDPRITKTLNQIQNARPKALMEGEADTKDSAWLVQQYRSVIRSRNARQANKGPMGAAFVTKNPMLPDDYFQGPALDSFVEKINKQVEFSLIDCPGRFTVRVASFYGKSGSDMLNHRIKNTDEISDALDHAALQANKMVTELRRRGVEAYEFHDRFGSFVTIGSFDRLGPEQQNGTFQYDAQILQVMNQYCGYRQIEGQDPRTGARIVKSSINAVDFKGPGNKRTSIPFDLEGKPMAVPKRDSSKLYNGSLLGGR